MEQERLTKKEIDLKDPEQYYFRLPAEDDASRATDTLACG